MNTEPILIHAAAIVDAAGLHSAPGAILVQPGQVMAVGSPQEIGEVAGATKRTMHDSIVLPALVNAHAHLDLTHIGPLAYGNDFAAWLDRILQERAAIEEQGIQTSVLHGADLSRRGGTGLIGDIAGTWSSVPVQALRESDLAGVSYLEIFGIGQREDATIEQLQRVIEHLEHDADHVRLGISPHAPYTCSEKVYRAVADIGLPIMTHLAESLEEREFVQHATGRFADFLRRFDLFDDSIVGLKCDPIEHIADTLDTTPAIAAHLNYVDDAALAILAASKITVAYCPRASAYFGHPHDDWPPHRYRDMLANGINVALGTDSIVCLDTPDRISVLDEMRYLYQRDGTSAEQLLAMATVNGAQGLGIDPALVTLSPGAVAGIIALRGRSLDEAMQNTALPEWVDKGQCCAAVEEV